MSRFLDLLIGIPFILAGLWVLPSAIALATLEAYGMRTMPPSIMLFAVAIVFIPVGWRLVFRRPRRQ